ncbi:hypothetical protein AVEN_179443-1 [Araneus ventricosus]|uniref:Uncharacterized protein n=1 Tax=Araneus ventricosus TaxID=182803 RepID=A0A4Y2BE29_ARAVE|nr:hypothetical protein AVEN_179443-1 [Araneus ventricosus]
MAEEQHVKVIYIAIENHLAILENDLKKYFLADDNLVAKYEWVGNLFQNTLEDLSTAKEEIFIDFTASGEIKRQFSNKSLFEFWAGIDNEFSALETRVFGILLPFSKNPTLAKPDFLRWLLSTQNIDLS